MALAAVARADPTLLRSLALLGSSEQRSLYLEERSRWCTGQGHPWQLVLACRALLVRQREPQRALALMLEGHRLGTGADAGPTLRLIGSTLGVIAMGWGRDSVVTIEQLEALRERLPSAGASVDALRDALREPGDDPLALMVRVLPVNFH